MAQETKTKLEQARERVEKMGFSNSPNHDLDFIFADWDNQEEHIDWLLTASKEEIASWVAAGWHDC